MDWARPHRLKIRQVSAAFTDEVSAVDAGGMVKDLRIERHNGFISYLNSQNTDIDFGVDSTGDIPAEYIHKCVTDALNIEPDPNLNIPSKTPDGFMISDGYLYIIDVKTVTNLELQDDTVRKYREVFEVITNRYGINLSVNTVNFHPHHHTITTYPNADVFPPIPVSEDLIAFSDEVNQIIQRIQARWQGNQTFLAAQHDAAVNFKGSFTERDDWMFKCLLHPEWQSVKAAMGAPIAKLMKRCITGNLTQAERNELSDYYRRSTMAKGYGMKHKLLTEGSVPHIMTQGTADEITNAIRDMHTNTAPSKSFVTQAKPSCFYYSTRGHHGLPNGNYARIAKFAQFAQSCRSQHPVIEVLKNVHVSNAELYETGDFPADQEGFSFRARQVLKVSDGELRNRLFRNAKVGVDYVKRSARDSRYYTQEKPECLDYTDAGILEEHSNLIHDQLPLLTERVYLANDVSHMYMDDSEMERKNPEAIKFLKWVRETYAFSWLSDQEDRLPNMLAVAGLLKNNEIGLILGKSNTSMHIVYPGKSLTSQESSVCYNSIHILSDDKVPVDCGLIDAYIKIPRSIYALVITKPVRLDPTRVGVLTCAHTRFQLVALHYILTALDTYDTFENIPNYLRNNIIGVSFFLVQQCTLPFTNLVDKMKYIVQDVLADVSNVSGYISEKLDITPKNSFTMFVYKHFMTQIKFLRQNFREGRNQPIVVEAEDVIEAGIEGLVIPSVVIPELQLPNVQAVIQDYVLAWYVTSKGLHNQVHNLLKLYKVPLEFQEELNIQGGMRPDVDKRLMLASFIKYWDTRGSSSIEARNRCFTKMKIDKTWTQIPTLTSTKSVVHKLTEAEKRVKTIDEAKLLEMDPDVFKKRYPRYRRINGRVLDRKTGQVPLELRNKDLWHQVRSSRVFDEMERLSSGLNPDVDLVNPKSVIEITDHGLELTPCVTVFPKQQRTGDDREIYMVDIVTKCSLYLIESLMKQLCAENQRECISLPGDRKTQKIKSLLIQSMRNQQEFSDRETNGMQFMKLNISADASKWSARDYSDKFMLFIATLPCLLPQEKWKLIFHLLNYRMKVVVLKDSVLETIIDKELGDDNVFWRMTDGFTKNYVKVTQNWLQGNFNYMSSLVHAIMHETIDDCLVHFADAMAEVNGNIPTTHYPLNSAVHSDDSLLSFCFELPEDISLEKVANCTFDLMVTTGKAFSIKYNDKKTFISKDIVEFLSKLFVNSEYHTNYMRSLLPIFIELPFGNITQDMASGLGPLTQATAEGAPPSLVYLAQCLLPYRIAHLNAMLPGMVNDVGQYFQNGFHQLPTCVTGSIGSDITDSCILGGAAYDYSRVFEILKSCSVPFIEIPRMINSIVTDRINPVDMEFLKILSISLEGYREADITQVGTYGVKDRFFNTALIPMNISQVKETNKYLASAKYSYLSKDGGLAGIIQTLRTQHPMWSISKPVYPHEYADYNLYKMTELKYRQALFTPHSSHGFLLKVLNRRTKVVPKKALEQHDPFMPVLDATDESEKLTLNEALEYLKAKADSVVLTTEKIRAIMSTMLLSNQQVIDYLTTKNAAKLTSEIPKKSRFIVQEPSGFRQKVVQNPPSLVIKKYFFPAEFDNDSDVLYLDEAVQSDLDTISDVLRAYNITDLARADHPDYVQNITKILSLVFHHITNKMGSNRLYILPSRMQSGPKFVWTLMGSRQNDARHFVYTSIVPNIHMYLKGNRQRGDIQMQRTRLQELFGLLWVLDHLTAGVGDQRGPLSILLGNINIEGTPVREVLQNGLVDKYTRSICAAILYWGGCMPYDAFKRQSIPSVVQKEWLVAQQTADVGDFHVIYELRGVALVVKGSSRVITAIKFEIPDGQELLGIEGPILTAFYKDFARIIQVMSLQTANVRSNSRSYSLRYKSFRHDPQGDWLIKTQRGFGTRITTLTEARFLGSVDACTWVKFPIPYRSQSMELKTLKPYRPFLDHMNVTTNTPLFVNRTDLVKLVNIDSFRDAVVNRGDTYNYMPWLECLSYRGMGFQMTIQNDEDLFESTPSIPVGERAIPAVSFFETYNKNWHWYHKMFKLYLRLKDAFSLKADGTPDPNGLKALTHLLQIEELMWYRTERVGFAMFLAEWVGQLSALNPDNVSVEVFAGSEPVAIRKANYIIGKLETLRANRPNVFSVDIAIVKNYRDTYIQDVEIEWGE
ncbi:RNA-dependent RNA polymerase [Chinese mitten crab virus 1]|uniref:RNA-directed RNA polymerase L n=1 Tax=Chinese mitten crab virus 1 TaxID=2849698 RepID=A0A482IE18_9VIRU|nr:RNA-dependent RNA polymerase [Chinese mitten crab virus 1]QBP05470.1 RNA-dependent RNA polymerase [Chinese mitten crab virus 1]